jgi:hypothetical protein
MQYTTFSDVQINALIEAINSDGYAVLPGWATRAELTQLQTFVATTVAAAGNDYVALTGQQAVAGSLLYEWGGSPNFIDLCKRIVTTATGRHSTEQGLHQVLRCLTGERGQRESLIFHYDSFVLTTIMPVCMPDNPGDLLMLPNHRPLRRTYAFNLVDKLRVDNRWVQRRLAKDYANHADKFTQVRMQPGDLYLFWGYRSLHTNLPADADAVRATAVFHYHNLHADSSLAHRIRQSLAYLKPNSPRPM